MTTFNFNNWGTLSSASATDGSSVTLTSDATTNYAAPTTVTTQSYSQTLAYNSWLGITEATGLNGEQLSMTYDSYGRPSLGTSPYGATVQYLYGTSTPFTQKQYAPNGITTTTPDGLGRAILVARGDSNGVQSYTQTVYAPCACSPLGKVQQVSQPYAPGASTIYWTTYAYDGLGRTLSVTQPDGVSTTTTSYSGNQTTVTDPAGNWKQYTTDALGNLTTVVEPDPANQPGGTLSTSYTYDWMNHVVGVSMPRGSTTQTRTFVYDNAGRLTSATNPENGTVSYVYNTDNTLQYKQDAKGQQTVYTYDSQKRVTMMQRYSAGQNNYPYEDLCMRVTYTYDTNPLYPSFSQNSTGRLTTVQYGSTSATSGSGYGNTCVWAQNSAGGTTTFSENYSYHPAGAVTAKKLVVTRTDPGYSPAVNSILANYSYDSAGRVYQVTYPLSPPFPINPGNSLPGPVTFTYGYDTLGRPNSLTDQGGTSMGYFSGNWSGTPVNWVQNVQYDLSSRMTSMEFVSSYMSSYDQTDPSYAQQSMTYNVNGQMTGVNWIANNHESYLWTSPAVGMTYSYAAQTNGQITQETDTLSGETITYQYDQLKRLTSASSTPTAGSSASAYTQTYQYDGFGNLTAEVLNGTSTPIGVNAATNRLTNSNYDANGNMLTGVGATFTYDEGNRVESAAEVSGGTEYYGYGPDNKRIYRLTATGQELITFYGAQGEKLGVFSVYGAPLYSNIWFAERLIVDSNYAVYGDRMGTNRANGWNVYGALGGFDRFYPYGDEITSTGNDRTKFATYTRDSFTGLDYADQRFYASTYGNFTSPDPSMDNVDYNNPGTWNAYAYTNGDPINGSDPSGLVTCGNLPIVGGGTVAGDVNANTAQGHFIDLVWHEAGSLSQAGGNVSNWTAEFEYIAQAIWDRYELVSGDAAVTGANGTVYSAAAGNISQLGYGGYGSSLNTVLINSAAGTGVLNSQGQLVSNAAELQNDLNENQTFQYAPGDVALQGSNGSSLWVTPDCYSVVAAMEFANGAAAGINYNPAGVFVTSWNSSAPVNNPNYAAGVEQLLGSAGPTNFYGFTGFTYGTYVPPVRRPRPPRNPRGPRPQ